ncbi:MAG: hypothetical protein K6T30_01770 [Alicyclobacillus sp.]|nr:hypothetical protein [Alicyclobacillus sp.]
MFWAALVSIALLGIGQYRSLLQASAREKWIWAAFSGITLIMSACGTWLARPTLHPLGWLEFLFGPPTRFLYRIL